MSSVIIHWNFKIVEPQHRCCIYQAVTISHPKSPAYKASPKRASKPTATAPVPYSLPSLSAAAAAEDVEAAAEPVEDAEVPEALPDAEGVPEPTVPLLLPLPPDVVEVDIEAFFDPQMKLWQKVWPARSFGCAVTHCATHSSHSREGRVCV
jgi:hypothetical protein